MACEHCSVPGQPRICEQPWCITTVGDLRPCILDEDNQVMGPDLRAVTWPRCPLLRGDIVYNHGFEAITATDLAMLRYEAGSLRDPDTSAAEVQLIMVWLRDRDYPDRILEARRVEQRRIKETGML